MCSRCGGVYGERQILLPTDTVIKVPVPNGPEVEVVQRLHDTLQDCLLLLRTEAERQKKIVNQAKARLETVIQMHNSLVDQGKVEQKRQETMN